MSNLSNAREIDDRGSMHADELSSAETFLQRRKRFPHEMPAASRMHRGVIIVGLDPLNLLDIDDQVGASATKDQTTWGRVMGSRSRLASSQSFSCPLHRSTKSRLMEWLDEVINRVCVEGLNRKRVVRRDEDHERPLARVQLSQQLEPVTLGHLNIEKREVRR